MFSVVVLKRVLYDFVVQLVAVGGVAMKAEHSCLCYFVDDPVVSPDSLLVRHPMMSLIELYGALLVNIKRADD